MGPNTSELRPAVTPCEAGARLRAYRCLSRRPAILLFTVRLLVQPLGELIREFFRVGGCYRLSAIASPASTRLPGTGPVVVARGAKAPSSAGVSRGNRSNTTRTLAATAPASPSSSWRAPRNSWPITICARKLSVSNFPVCVLPHGDGRIDGSRQSRRQVSGRDRRDGYIVAR
jgi:hypothetical protein